MGQIVPRLEYALLKEQQDYERIADEESKAIGHLLMPIMHRACNNLALMQP